jgi:uncharacterized protein YciI
MRFIFALVLVCNSLFSVCQPKLFSFVFLHKKNDAQHLEKEQSEKIMQGHMANIERLAKEGKLLAAGPFEGGGGIFILNTTSIDEARQWLGTDPGVKANRWNIEILPYETTIGGVCPVKEPYEMVTYNFVRFTFDVTENSKHALTEHNEYISQLNNVVAAGNFGLTGSILIIGGEGDVTKSDPAIKSGLLTAENKTLWIAKGSFCEK